MMSEFKKLFDRTVELYARNRWLKYIDKELELYNKYESKASHYKNEACRHRQVAQTLFNEYLERYGKVKVDD